jgi:hypothetical protein
VWSPDEVAPGGQEGRKATKTQGRHCMEVCSRGHAGDEASGGATIADHRDQSIGGAKPHRSPTSPRRDCRTPGFTCRARLNDWPPTKREGHTSAPCLVQAVVVRRADSGYVGHRENLPLFPAVPGAGGNCGRPPQRMGRRLGDPVEELWPTPDQRETTTHPTGKGLLLATTLFSPASAGGSVARVDDLTQRRPGVDERPMADCPTTTTVRRKLDRHSGPATRAVHWLTEVGQRTHSSG